MCVFLCSSVGPGARGGQAVARVRQQRSVGGGAARRRGVAGAAVAGAAAYAVTSPVDCGLIVLGVGNQMT